MELHDYTRHRKAPAILVGVFLDSRANAENIRDAVPLSDSKDIPVSAAFVSNMAGSRSLDVDITRTGYDAAMHDIITTDMHNIWGRWEPQ